LVSRPTDQRQYRRVSISIVLEKDPDEPAFDLE